MTKEEIAKEISGGNAVVGIEFGSTRIKAVMIDSASEPVAGGAFDWENSLVDGVWTYSLEEIANSAPNPYSIAVLCNTAFANLCIVDICIKSTASISCNTFLFLVSM